MASTVEVSQINIMDIADHLLQDMNKLNLRFTSFNKFGFNNGHNMLGKLCTISDIVLIQEHWLKPFELSKFSCVNTEYDYFSKSAMENEYRTDIIYGRSHGDICIMFTKNLFDFVELGGYDEHSRIMCVRLKCAGKYFCVFNVYLPCQGSLCCEDFELTLIDIFSFIDFTVANLEEGHDWCILIGGDFNFEFDDFLKLQRYELLKQLTYELDMVCTDTKDVSQIPDVTFKNITCICKNCGHIDKINEVHKALVDNIKLCSSIFEYKQPKRVSKNLCGMKS